MININLKPTALFHKGTVLVSMLLIVLLASIIAFTTVGTMATNQRVVGNSVREMEAFEKAEAGLEYGVKYGQNNMASITASPSGGYINYTVPVPSGSNYTITYSNPTSGNYDLLEVTSVGTSGDGTATQTVKQRVYRSNFLAINPPAGVTSRGNVSLSGNVEISNEESIAIWTGGLVTAIGSVEVEGSVRQLDLNLSTLTGDQFFSNFFNKTKSAAQSSSDITFTNTSNTNYSGNYGSDPNGLNGVTGKTIYISQGSGTATINSNAVIGSAANPVILIVDGNLTFAGSATIYGVVYVTGNMSSSGTGSVHGAVFTEGTMTSTGTADFNLDVSLNNLNNLITLVKVPGSWRDF